MVSPLTHKLSQFFGEDTFGMPSTSYFEETLKTYGSQPMMANLFPYETYDPQNQLFRNRDSIGFVLETFPLVGASEEMQKEISSLFQYILPEGSSLQVMLWGDPHIGHICDVWKNSRANSVPILQKLAKVRATFLENMAFHSPLDPYCLRNFRCFLSYTQGDPGNNPVVIQGVAQLMSQIKTALEMLRLPVFVWSPKDLIDTLEGILCLDPDQTKPRDRTWNPLDALGSQITSAESNLTVGYKGLSLNEGKTHFRSYRVRKYPETWSLHAMRYLIGDAERDMAQIPCPFLIHYGVHVPLQDKPQRTIQSKALYVDAQANAPLGKYLPSLKSEAIELNFVRGQLESGERVVQTDLTVALFSPPEKLPKAEQILLNLFQGKEWRLEANHARHLPVLLSVLPMSWGPGMLKSLKNSQRLKTTITTESANLLPLQGEWHGTKSPALILAGRHGQLFHWSPFDSSSNYNMCVLGHSGAGKSVFMQELVTAVLGTGGRVVVLDVGRSFQKLGLIFKGQFIQVSDTVNLSLNPFSHLTLNSGDDSIDRDNLVMVKQVLTSMISPSGTLEEIENSFLQMALDAVLKEKQNKTEVSDIASWFLAHGDQRARDMGTRLYAFSRDGVYGWLFNRPSTVTFNNSLIITEFEDIKQSKDLSAVILQILIVTILTMMYRGDRKTPFAIIIDEAWEFLAGKAGETLIEAAARQARKYGGFLVVGSQNAEDFHKSLAAKAAFNNSAWKCYLGQSNEAFKTFEKEDLITSPAMLSLLKTVKMSPGKYGEIMIVSETGYAVGRLILDPYSQLLYSTKADEFTAVETLMRQGIPVEEAIERLLEKRRKSL